MWGPPLLILLLLFKPSSQATGISHHASNGNTGVHGSRALVVPNIPPIGDPGDITRTSGPSIGLSHDEEGQPVDPPLASLRRPLGDRKRKRQRQRRSQQSDSESEYEAPMAYRYQQSQSLSPPGRLTRSKSRPNNDPSVFTPSMLRVPGGPMPSRQHGHPMEGAISLGGQVINGDYHLVLVRPHSIGAKKAL